MLIQVNDVSKVTPFTKVRAYYRVGLISTSQPKLVMESSVQSSLHPNYDHQIVYGKFKLTIYYRPPYGHNV